MVWKKWWFASKYLFWSLQTQKDIATTCPYKHPVLWHEYVQPNTFNCARFLLFFECLNFHLNIQDTFLIIILICFVDLILHESSRVGRLRR